MPQTNDRFEGDRASQASFVPPDDPPRPESGERGPSVRASDWDDRIDGLLPSLPRWIGRCVTWLRVPSRRWFRLGAGLALIAGSLLAILPIFGLWMLPLGLALIGEDYPPLKILLERTARWGERVWQRMRRR